MTDPSTWNGSVADPETTAHLALYGVTVTQVIRLPELVEFRADKRVRKKLFEGAQLGGELLCYEAGPQLFSHRVLSYRHRLWPNERNSCPGRKVLKFDLIKGSFLQSFLGLVHR